VTVKPTSLRTTFGASTIGSAAMASDALHANTMQASVAAIFAVIE
jgi:hypothetical protein